MKIDTYYQRQKCRLMILESRNMRHMRIFAGLPRGGGIKQANQTRVRGGAKQSFAGQYHPCPYAATCMYVGGIFVCSGGPSSEVLWVSKKLQFSDRLRHHHICDSKISIKQYQGLSL